MIYINGPTYIQADALKLTAEQIQDFTHIAIIVTRHL